MTKNSHVTTMMIVLGIIGLCIWAFRNERYSNAPSLTVNRHQAIELALHYLDTQNELPQQILQTHVKVFRNRPDNNAKNLYYVWQKDGSDVYNKLTDRYIFPTSWMVSVYADTVNYHIFLTGDGTPYRTTVEFAEPAASTSLSKERAVDYALTYIQNRYSLNPASISFFRADSTKTHGRTDWTIEYQDLSLTHLTSSKLLISVKLIGNRLFDSYRYVKVPESWVMQTKPLDKKLFRLKTFAMLLLSLLFLPALLNAINSYFKGQFHIATFQQTIFLFLFCFVISKLLYIPSDLSRMSPHVPLYLQWIPLAFKDALRFLVLAVFVSTFAGFLSGWKHNMPRYQGSVIWSALGFSTFILGVHFAALRFFPRYIPYLPQILPAETLSPMFAYAIHTFVTYLVVLNLLSILMYYIHKFTLSGERNILITLIALTIIASLCAILFYQNNYRLNEVLGVFIYGLSMAIALLLGYLVIFRHNFAVLSLSVFILTLAISVDYSIVHPFRGVISGTVAAATLMFLYSILGLVNERTE